LFWSWVIVTSTKKEGRKGRRERVEGRREERERKKNQKSPQYKPETQTHTVRRQHHLFQADELICYRPTIFSSL
jgi:hypothetical protein